MPTGSPATLLDRPVPVAPTAPPSPSVVAEMASAARLFRMEAISASGCRAQGTGHKEHGTGQGRCESMDEIAASKVQCMLQLEAHCIRASAVQWTAGGEPAANGGSPHMRLWSALQGS